MHQAAFSIENYKLERVSIDAANHVSGKFGIHFEVSGTFDSNTSIYTLNFEVTLTDIEFESKPYINLKCLGTSKFEQVTDLKDIPEYFYANSLAILYPYVRAYASMVTVQAQIPAAMLPTLNLSVYGPELLKNTKQI